MRNRTRAGYAGIIVLATAAALVSSGASSATDGPTTAVAAASITAANGTAGATPQHASSPAVSNNPPAPVSIGVMVDTRPKVVTAARVTAPKPATPKGLPTAIEPLATYVGQTACEPGFRPGTAALGKLLTATYPNTHFGGNYSCGTDGIISEHYDGRALDWMDSVRDPKQAAQANAVLHWLLDPDKAGNRFAMARRLGVMYVIWNNQIWGSWDGKWAPYNDCAHTPSTGRDSYCHRNHIHISLSWDGAWGRTSFFSKQVVTRTDFGPCRAADLNWAAPYYGRNYKGCVVYPKLSAPAAASPIRKALISWSGDVIGPGSTGPAVVAVQNALRVPATGSFDHATSTAVIAFKKARKMVGNPIVEARVWRALLAANPVSTKPVKKAATKVAIVAPPVTGVRTAPSSTPVATAPTPRSSTPAPSPSATPTSTPTSSTPASSASGSATASATSSTSSTHAPSATVSSAATASATTAHPSATTSPLPSSTA